MLTSTLLWESDYYIFRDDFPKLYIFKLFPNLEKIYFKKLFSIV